MSKKIIFVGGIGSKEQFGGELTKNKLIIEKLSEYCINNQIQLICIDTYKSNHSLIKKIKVVFRVIYHLFFSINNHFVISTSPINIYQLLKFFTICPFHHEITYLAIGGTLGELLLEHKLDPKAFRKIKRITVEGNKMKEQLNKCGFSNVIVTGNYKHITKLPEINKYNDNRIHFMFFSRITKVKGCDLIIECIKELNDTGYKDKYQVDFYGNVLDTYNKTFTSFVESTPNVYHKGTVDLSDFDSYSILAKYHYMLFPTFWKGEGFPGVIIDSYISGVPIIASDWSLNTEYIINGYTGIIIKAKDKNSLLDAMKDAILNKYDVMAFSNNCQTEAIRYDIDNLDIDKLLN